MPIGFPITKPSMTPQAIRLVRSPLAAPPEKVTPALDRANNGSTRNETQSFSLRVNALRIGLGGVDQLLETSEKAIGGRHVPFRLGGTESLHHVDANFLELLERKARRRRNHEAEDHTGDSGMNARL